MTYLLSAVAASGVFIVAGWRSRHALGITPARGGHALSPDPLWGETETDSDDTASTADAGTAVRLALKRLYPVLASQSIQAEVAAPSGLLVRMGSVALADLVEEVLAAVVHSAPASRILLTAAAHGDHVEIGITDDMPGADLAVRTAGVKGLIARAATRGGVLNVDVRRTEGTTLTLRLPAVTRAWRNGNDHALPEPAEETTHY